MASKTSMPDHVSNTYEDLSGVSTEKFSNPYDALIAACEDDAVRLSWTMFENSMLTSGHHRLKSSQSTACTVQRETLNKRPSSSTRTSLASISIRCLPNSAILREILDT